MKALHFCKGISAFIFLCVIGIVMTVSSQSTVTINVDGAATVIPKEIFGVLMERLGRQWTGTNNSGIYCGTTQPNTNGMRNDVIEAFKECGIGCAEWPGGCASNGYNWSSNKRPANDVGVDRFIQFCNLTGAEAVIAGRPLSGDAQSNYNFAQYVLDSLQYPLKWFKVGNEVWGCGGNQNDTTYYKHNYPPNYNLLKNLKNNANGKNLRIIAANDIEGKWNWLPNMLNSIGSTIDGVEYHDYLYYPSSCPAANPSNAWYYQIQYDVLKRDIGDNLRLHVIPALNSYDPNKRIKLALDEWGDWLQNMGVDGWIQQNTVMDAVSSGLHLNMFISMSDRMGVVCLAQGVSVIHSVLNINTSSVMVKTPTFYVFKLLKPHHTNNAKWAPITTSNIQTITASTQNNGSVTMPVMNVAASVDDQSYVNLSFTNVDISNTRSVTATLTSSHAGYRVVSAEVVTGSAVNSCNNFGAAEQVNIQTLAASNYSVNGKVLTATLPTKSVVMFRLLPTDVVVNPENFRQRGADAFAIKAGPQGAVLITSVVSKKMPVIISLYSVDGRMLMERVSRTLEAGNSTCVLKTDSRANGSYIVAITGKDINFSKRVMVAR